MSAALKSFQAQSDPELESVRRHKSWRSALSRKNKIEAMFEDQVYLDALMNQGRYLRLCAALALASLREERARQDANIDAMVNELRRVSATTAIKPS